MNGYFAKSANGNVVQPSVSFESPKNTLDGASPIVDGLPFLSFGEQSLLMTRIYFDNRLGSVLMFDDKSQFLTAVASVINDIVRVESAIGESRLGENTSGNTDIAQKVDRQ